MQNIYHQPNTGRYIPVNKEYIQNFHQLRRDLLNLRNK